MEHMSIATAALRRATPAAGWPASQPVRGVVSGPAFRLPQQPLRAGQDRRSRCRKSLQAVSDSRTRLCQAPPDGAVCPAFLDEMRAWGVPHEVLTEDGSVFTGD